MVGREGQLTQAWLPMGSMEKVRRREKKGVRRRKNRIISANWPTITDPFIGKDDECKER